MFRNSLRLLGVAAISAAISLPFSVSAEGEVNVYSARQENLIKPLLDDFTRDTGVEVNLLTGRADELLQRQAELLQAARIFRFDASDAMPERMSRAFWQAVLDFTADQARLDGILEELDAVQAEAYG